MFLPNNKIQGLYGIVDSGHADRPLMLAEAMLRGGCQLLQLRCKDWDHERTLQAALRLRALCDRAGATLVVNDDAEIAARVRADAVHVGQKDADTASVRRAVGPDCLIGRSTHTPAQLRQAIEEGADYVAFGPIFATATAAAKGERGLEALRDAVCLVDGAVPLVAIGGINAARLPSVRATGVDCWAVISAISQATDPERATRALAGP
jgi:thiamine-phosphate diphosphorylase